MTADEEIVEVFRVLRYVGPRKWIRQTLENSYVKEKGTVRMGKNSISEVTCSEDIILCPTREVAEKVVDAIGPNRVDDGKEVNNEKV